MPRQRLIDVGADLALGLVVAGAGTTALIKAGYLDFRAVPSAFYLWKSLSPWPFAVWRGLVFLAVLLISLALGVTIRGIFQVVPRRRGVVLATTAGLFVSALLGLIMAREEWGRLRFWNNISDTHNQWGFGLRGDMWTIPLVMFGTAAAILLVGDVISARKAPLTRRESNEV